MCSISGESYHLNTVSQYRIQKFVQGRPNDMRIFFFLTNFNRSKGPLGPLDPLLCPNSNDNSMCLIIIIPNFAVKQCGSVSKNLSWKWQRSKLHVAVFNKHYGDWQRSEKRLNSIVKCHWHGAEYKTCSHEYHQFLNERGLHSAVVGYGALTIRHDDIATSTPCTVGIVDFLDLGHTRLKLILDILLLAN